jgi:hypothetical protein
MKMRVQTPHPSYLIKTFKQPKKAFLELNKFYQLRIRRRNGTSVISRDWDNLLILDACRYDTFRKEN